MRLAKHFEVSTDWLLDLSDCKVSPQNENLDRDLLLRVNATEKELRRYKTAFTKITKSLKFATEAVEELEGEK